MMIAGGEFDVQNTFFIHTSPTMHEFEVIVRTINEEQSNAPASLGSAVSGSQLRA